MNAPSVKLHEIAAVLSILHCMSNGVHSLLLTTIDKHFSRYVIAGQLATVFKLSLGVRWSGSDIVNWSGVNLFILFFQVLWPSPFTGSFNCSEKGVLSSSTQDRPGWWWKYFFLQRSRCRQPDFYYERLILRGNVPSRKIRFACVCECPLISQGSHTQKLRPIK